MTYIKLFYNSNESSLVIVSKTRRIHLWNKNLKSEFLIIAHHPCCGPGWKCSLKTYAGVGGVHSSICQSQTWLQRAVGAWRKRSECYKEWSLCPPWIRTPIWGLTDEVTFELGLLGFRHFNLAFLSHSINGLGLQKIFVIEHFFSGHLTIKSSFLGSLFFFAYPSLQVLSVAQPLLSSR